MPDPITWTATEAEMQRDLIAEWLRGLAATASSEQARGTYLYAADGVEGGEWRKVDLLDDSPSAKEHP